MSNKKLTSETLKLMIYSMSRPNGGYEKLLTEHIKDLAVLLETLVLPELEKQENLSKVLQQHEKYYNDEYDGEDGEVLWDGMGD